MLALAAVSLVSLLAAACGGDDDDSTSPTAAPSGSPAGGIPTNIGKDDSAQITGAGSTFVAPMLQAWFDDYNKGVARGVQVNYQSIGSGGGVQQYTARTVDFGASDAAMSDDELSKATDTQHIPIVSGSVVITYNVTGVSKALKFDGGTVARIYLGDIKKWNDAAITALNPGVSLPSADIQVVHRSDGSGTSFVFTDWLTKVSPDWKTKVGTSKNPNWPAGQGGQGNEGVTNAVKQTPNSIGYIELNYALVNKLPFADVKNKAGNFITPSIASTAAAGAGVTLPADYRVSIVDPDEAQAYPVSSFVFLLLRKNTESCAKEKPLVNALYWILNDKAAQKTATELSYVPISDQVVQSRLNATLKSLTCEGKPILPQ